MAYRTGFSNQRKSIPVSVTFSGNTDSSLTSQQKRTPYGVVKSAPEDDVPARCKVHNVGLGKRLPL